MDVPFTSTDIDAVLFDMDGTLVNTDDVDVQKWAKRIERVTYMDKEHSNEAARSFVMSLETPGNAFFTLMDAIGLDNFVIGLMIKLYGGSEDKPLPSVPGIQELIPKIAPQYKLAIVSTRSAATTEMFLSHLNLLEYFPVIGGRDTTKRIKPHPQPVLDAARRLGVDPKRCLMVGDTTVDVLSAKRAGAYACAVLCGFGQRRELERAGADIILEQTPDVEGLLLAPSLS